MSNFSYIFITGASSGLGKAMALSFSKKGVLLFLSARNKERLNNVAQQTRQSDDVKALKELNKQIAELKKQNR